MGLIGRSWSALARGRERLRRGQDVDQERRRLRWVSEQVPGRTFADIGGLFQYMGDVAFLAEEAGATEVTLFDVGDPDLIAEAHPEWGWFEQKREARRSNVRYVQGDLEDPVAVSRLGPHDIVFYSGVLYHTPNPFLQLVHLRQVTRELAYLSTITIPEIPGYDQACIFYPYLRDADRAPYAAGYPTAGNLLGIGTPIDERPMYGYGNCWWGITRSALRSMLQAARFEVVEEPFRTSPFVTNFIIRPLAFDPMLPPSSYFRERGEARDRGEPRWAFDTWYEDQRRAGSSDA